MKLWIAKWYMRKFLKVFPWTLKSQLGHKVFNYFEQIRLKANG